MDTKYIHSHQLLTAKNNIGANLYPLKTFVAWALFANKDYTSPGIATIETKGILLRTHYGMSTEDIVERVSKFLVMSFVQYVESQQTIKSFLLSCINYNLDKIMADMRRKEIVYAPKPNRTYSSKDIDSRPICNDTFLEKHDDTIGFFNGIKTKKPLIRQATSPTVVLRKKRQNLKHGVFWICMMVFRY